MYEMVFTRHQSIQRLRWKLKINKKLVGERESDMWDPWFFFWWGGAGNGLRCFRKLSRIDWLGPDGGGHALWPRKWSQGTLPPHFLLRLSATAAPRLAFSFSQQTLRPFLVSVPPLSSTLFALTPAMWSYGSADIPILWVKRWWELDGGRAAAWSNLLHFLHNRNDATISSSLLW